MNMKELLSTLTLEEKIGQLMQLEARLFAGSSDTVTGPLLELGIDEENLKYVGSVLNVNDGAEAMAIQKKHLEEDPKKIPMIFMRDIIHGCRTVFPIPLGIGASFDPELMKDCSRMAAKEGAAKGHHVTFTPMVDYVRDARWGRVMETCGEDVLLNSRMGAAQVKGFQGEDLTDGEHLATCVKHFAGYGGAEAGRDYNTVELSERELREHYLPAYKACIDAGTTMLMPSFNTLNGVPSVANPWLMKKILKDEWGFDGVVISDYAAVQELIYHGVAADQKEAAKLALDCGCHMEMCSSTYYHSIKDLLEEGTITMEEIDRLVLEVLELKEKLGLFENPYHGALVDCESACLTKEHRALARKAAEESAVLLKNEGILPISKDCKKVALIGPFADSKEIIGFWSFDGKDEESVTIYEGVRRLIPEAEISVVAGCTNDLADNNKDGFAEAVQAAKNADAVILCLGEKQVYSGEGKCRTDLRLPGVQEELALAVAAANPNTAMVTFSGRPIVLTELAEKLPAILHMWFPGTEGGNAVANLLFGEANPCGKVPMSFPKAVGQCPIYYDHPNTGRPKKEPEGVYEPFISNYLDCGNLPLYSFGHGLSYSKFVYESLELSQDVITADDEVKVQIVVFNDSDKAGKEVVQLYMRDPVASNARPVQKLIDFTKVELAAGERKTVEFTIKEDMLRFWNNEMQLVSEPGEFQISTGYADHLMLTKRLWLR